MIRKSNGFSLIEVIVVLVVTGILGAIMIPFMSTALTRSHEPLDNLRHSANLSSDMAKVVAGWDEIWKDVYDQCAEEEDYQDFLNCVDDELEDAIQDAVIFENSNLDQAKLMKFEEFEESGCGSQNNWSDCEVIKIRIKGQDNPGEKLSYFFSFFAINDLRGCEEEVGESGMCNTSALKDGWECEDEVGNNCKKWVKK